MMVTDFWLPTNGWIQGISDKAKRQIEHRFPQLPVAAVDREVGYYLIEREGRKGHPPPAELRKRLRDISSKAQELNDLIQELKPAHSLMEQAEYLAGVPGCLDRLMLSLTELPYAAAKTATFIPKGRPASPRHWLVLRLAKLLSDAGMEIDGRGNGNLCQLVAIALEGVGEVPGEVRKLVAGVLGKRIKRRDKSD